MVKKYHHRESPPQPTYWRLSLDCMHQPVLSNEEIKNSLVDSRYSSAVDGTITEIVCPQCAQHKPGSCDKGNIIHKVVGATPFFSSPHDLWGKVHEKYNQQQEKQQKT